MSEGEITTEKLIMISLSRAKPTPRYRRTDRIVNVLKENVARNMKVGVDNVKISQKLNEELWSTGKRSRRPRISVKVIKDSEGVVTAKLPDEREEEGKEAEKAKEATKAEKKEEPKEEPKVVETKPTEPEEKAEAKEAEKPAEAQKE
jgi:large subunit ribosomal protein L31e